MNFRQFVNHMREEARYYGRVRLRGEGDDWPPIMVTVGFEGEDPHRFIPPGPFPGMSDETIKDAIAWAIRKANRLMLPKHLGLTCSTWMVEHEGDPGGIVPSRHPDRVESVALYVVDAERAETHTAPIIRRPGRPPTLGGWQSGMAYGGRFHDALFDSLR